MKEKIELKEIEKVGESSIVEPEVVESRPEYRMYSLVVRQLSTMQKGVQTAHALSNYALYHSEDLNWKQWAEEDCTLIVLDGGTCPDLDDIQYALDCRHIKHEVFYEPDLNDMMTSICLLAPEQVWDKELYPDFEDWCMLNGYDEQVKMNWFVFYDGEWIKDESTLKVAKEKWEEFMGGYENTYLRELLSSKRLAQ